MLSERLTRRLLFLALWMLCQAAHIVASVWMLAAALISPFGRRAWTLAIAHDRLANAALGGQLDGALSVRQTVDIERHEEF